MEEFTEAERKILEPYFSNLDKQVFVLKNMPEVVKGTLFSRYSRSAKPLRRLLKRPGGSFVKRSANALKKIEAGLPRTVQGCRALRTEVFWSADEFGSQDLRHPLVL